MLTDEDIEALSVAVHGGVSPEEHISHHAAIKQWIDRENKKAERYEKVRTSVLGWAVTAILGGIGTGVYRGVAYLKEHLK